MTRAGITRSDLLAPPARWPGLIALAGMALCQLPAMLPHPWWIQGLVSGLLAVQCYAVAVGLTAAARAVRARTTTGRRGTTGRCLDRAVPVLAVAATGAAVAINWISRRSLDQAVGQSPASPVAALMAVDAALILAAVLVPLGKLGT